MTGMDDEFWAGLDKQVAGAASLRETVLRATEKAILPPIMSVPALVKKGLDPDPVRTPVAAQGWNGVLDIINGAKMHAEAQREQLLEQAESFEQTIQKVREDAEAVRQQVRMLEAQHQETKVELERQVREVRAQAEEQVRDTQAKADVQIAEARSATQKAEERAAFAESWLRRIEEAATNLAPGTEAALIRRAA